MIEYRERHRKRLVENTNLNLHHDKLYLGLPVQTSAGPLIKEWLERIRLSIMEQLAKHSRVLALRIDLRFPANYWGCEEGFLGNEFLQDFRAYLRRELDRLPGNRNHDLMVLFAREYDKHERKPHFHLLILLNGNAFRGTGKWDLSCNNLYSRLYESWAYALGMRAPEIAGLIQFANGSALEGRGQDYIRSGSMLLQRGDEQMFRNLFWVSSYLAKVATKNFHDGCRPFVSPRLKFSDW